MHVESTTIMLSLSLVRIDKSLVEQLVEYVEKLDNFILTVKFPLPSHVMVFSVRVPVSGR